MKTLLIFVLLFSFSFASAQTITTVAGNGNYGYSGDGGLAIDAELADMYFTYPAFDNLGNMYIAQNGNNTIRKIDVNGIITTIAGQYGITGYSGDGGLAINALLFHPTSIAIDNNNNIFFSDSNGDYIRKIDPAGIITTVTGPVTTNCGVGDGGPLASAQFGTISSMVFDQFNNLYISDMGCNTVRKVSAAGVISTIAGNGTWGYSGDGGNATQAQLAYPTKVGIDNDGNVYIPDAQNHRIRKVNPAGIITTFAGNGIQGYSGDGGPAVNANMAFPGSVVIDNSNNVYYGDLNHVLRKIDASGTISTYAGNGIYGYSGDGGPAVLAAISLTEGRISMFNNDIFFANYTQGSPGNTIRKITNCLSVLINQQPVDASLCNSGNASFSIVTTNTSGYQWQLHDGTSWTNLTDNSNYAGSLTNTLTVANATVIMNNFQYRCIVTNICGSIYSAPATLEVKTPATPSINITTASSNICTGTPVSFSASAQNVGDAPIYEWQKNGVIVGLNSNTYNDNSLINGDIISCLLTSNATCITENTATSNNIIMTVTPKVTPGIEITASSTNICFGTPVTFISSITNGGATPVYSWYKNGIDLNINLPTYIDNTLNNGDIISCSITSSLSCTSTPTTISSPIVLTVSPLLSPTIFISSSANSICKNTPVLFTASSVNAGSMPLYQWKKNGTFVGSNINTYTDNSLINGDLITCTLTSSENCVTSSQATSNTLSINIYPDPIVSLDKTNTICEGGSRVIDAGPFSSYIWNTGSENRTITINNTGDYSVTVKDFNGCTATGTTSITTILPSPKNFLPKETSICSYGDLQLKSNSIFQSYLWNTGSNNSVTTIKQSGQYWLQVTNPQGCIGVDTITVLPKDCLKGFFMPNAFTPNNDGKNDLMKPILLGNVKQYRFYIYNRWGQILFETADLSKGWDGNSKGIKQDGNVFIWMCTYQFENESTQNKKGTFVLIR